MVKRLFLTVPRGCLRFVIVVFPDHTHLLFLGVGEMGFMFGVLHVSLELPFVRENNSINLPFSNSVFVRRHIRFLEFYTETKF